MPIGDNIDPATLDAATMANIPAADMSAATSADLAAMPADAMGGMVLI